MSSGLLLPRSCPLPPAAARRLAPRRRPPSPLVSPRAPPRPRRFGPPPRPPPPRRAAASLAPGPPLARDDEGEQHERRQLEHRADPRERAQVRPVPMRARAQPERLGEVRGDERPERRRGVGDADDRREPARLEPRRRRRSGRGRGSACTRTSRRTCSRVRKHQRGDRAPPRDEIVLGGGFAASTSASRAKPPAASTNAAATKRDSMSRRDEPRRRPEAHIPANVPKRARRRTMPRHASARTRRRRTSRGRSGGGDTRTRTPPRAWHRRRRARGRCDGAACARAGKTPTPFIRFARDALLVAAGPGSERSASVEPPTRRASGGSMLPSRRSRTRGGSGSSALAAAAAARTANAPAAETAVLASTTARGHPPVAKKLPAERTPRHAQRLRPHRARAPVILLEVVLARESVALVRSRDGHEDAVRGGLARGVARDAETPAAQRLRRRPHAREELQRRGMAAAPGYACTGRVGGRGWGRGRTPRRTRAF